MRATFHPAIDLSVYHLRTLLSEHPSSAGRNLRGPHSQRSRRSGGARCCPARICQVRTCALVSTSVQPLVPHVRGILALPTSATYSAAKAGLRAFLAAVHAELRGRRVHVSGIYPNAVDTAMLRHEATGGGSALNFLGAVQTIDSVANAYERAFDHPRLETYVPDRDSITCRLLNTFPSLTPRWLPLANRIGERGRGKYLARLRLTTSAAPHS